MKLALHFYKPGNQVGDIPIRFETKTKTIPPIFYNEQSFFPLYRHALALMSKNPPRIFRGRPVALRPFAVRYSAYNENGTMMKHISFDPFSPYNTYPTPRMIHGDYCVVFLVNYRF